MVEGRWCDQYELSIRVVGSRDCDELVISINSLIPFLDSIYIHQVGRVVDTSVVQRHSHQGISLLAEHCPSQTRIVHSVAGVNTFSYCI